MSTSERQDKAAPEQVTKVEVEVEHESLKYQLLGPSLTKAGQDSVDQSKVSEIIYNASKGTKFFAREQERDKMLTSKIDAILEKKRRVECNPGLLDRYLRAADAMLVNLEVSRDLSQHMVHVDCDAFYAAVELLDRPELADVPFAVGGGVLTTCNYVARKFGCRSGMAGFVAKKLCPELLLIKPNFEKYSAKATEIRAVFARYDARFESASCDEAYLNMTSFCAENDMSAADAVAQMRDEVHRAAKVTVSAGIAANAKLAKICSNVNKPNGQYELARDRATIMSFMRELPVRKVNGIGRVLERELAAIGIQKCGDIFEARAVLAPLFGDKTSEFLLGVYLGLGRTKVQPAEDYERKSVGTESTFRDMDDPTELRAKLRWTAGELEKDMARAECKGRTLVLKVKLHTYEVLTRQVVTPKAVFLADDLYRCSLPMLAKLEQERPGMKLRLMGLRCTHLVGTKKPDTTAFFGLRQAKKSIEEPAADRTTPVGDEDGWEPWPDELQVVKQLHDDASEHQAGASGQDEWWDCPICGRPQAAEEKRFNDHIDQCLSKQAIRDAVQQEAGHVPSTSRGADADKKRGRRPAAPDSRQKRLCFG